MNYGIPSKLLEYALCKHAEIDKNLFRFFSYECMNCIHFEKCKHLFIRIFLDIYIYIYVIQ